MRTRLVSGLAVLGLTAALVTAPVVAASAAPASMLSQDFESFSLGSVDGQNGWAVTNPAFDFAVADTTGLYGGALGNRALRVSNAVTSGSFGDQLFSEQLANEAGETSAENGGLSGGVRQSRYSMSFRFASADPGAEQPGLVMGVSPDRGDGARMSLVRLYDTPTGLKVTAWAYQTGDGGGTFVETTVASDLDRSVVHSLSMTADFVDGLSNDRVSVSVDGMAPVVIGSWEQYFRDVEGNPTRTVDSLLFRASIPAPNPAALLGKGFYIDAVTQASGPTPSLSARTITPTALAAGVGGWRAFQEPDWTSLASGQFVDGPTGTSGPGSIKVSLGPVVGGNNGKYYLGRFLPGVPVGDITAFSYRVLTATTNAGVMQPYVNMTVSGGGAPYANLVYDPNDPQSNPNPLPASNGVWRTIDPFAPATQWRNTRMIAGVPAQSYRTLSQWLQLAPDLTTHPTLGGIYVISGASHVYTPWTDYVAYLDGFDLTVAGARIQDTFDAGAPLSPTSVVTGNIQPRSATVTWVPDPGTVYAPVDSYEVVVDGTPQTVAADVSSLGLAPLTPGSTHRVSVRALRGTEWGPATATSFQTPAIPVPAAVSGLVAGAITTTSAILSWSADPTVGEGAVDSYEVSLTPTGSTQVVPATTLARALTGLIPGTVYAVTLTAHNVSGWSNPVSATFTTNDLDRRTPGAPTLTIGTLDAQGTLPLSWTANSADSADFPVQHWIVTVDGADEAYLPAATHSYSVTSLATGRHTITVRGTNTLGSAAFASQVIVLSPPPPPIAPPAPTASMAATPTAITIGAAATLHGRFTTGTTPVANATVALAYSKGGSWVAITATTTTADGSFTFTVKPTATTRYRAVTTGLPPAYVTVSGRPKITAKFSYAATRGKTTVRLTTVIAPRLAGATIRVQVLLGRRWLTVATPRLNSKSANVLTIGTFTTYTARYRVLIPATSTTATAASTSVLCTVPHR